MLVCWEKLRNVKQLSFKAKTKSIEMLGWDGEGQGEVIVTKEGNQAIIFNEKGIWQNKQGVEISFSNVFRWTLDRHKWMISLEHLRRGPDYPIFLFHLVPSGEHSLASVDAHLCEEDSYFGQIYFDVHHLRLNWRVIGPKKNEEIDYYYS